MTKKQLGPINQKEKKSNVKWQVRGKEVIYQENDRKSNNQNVIFSLHKVGM